MAKINNNNNDIEVFNLLLENGINTDNADINNICNEYIQRTNINICNSIGFNTLLLYIKDNYISKININTKDIKILDYWYYIYMQLNCICNNNTISVLGYSIMMGIPYSTIKTWKGGESLSATHTPTVKKWYELSENVLKELTTKGNIGAMFLLKSQYGYRENTPIAPQLTQNNLYIGTDTAQDMLAKYAKIG